MHAHMRICRLLPSTMVALAGCGQPLVPRDEDLPPADPGVVLDAAPGSNAGPTFAWMNGSRTLVGIEQRGPWQGAPVLEIDLNTLGMRHVSVGAGSHVGLRVASETGALYVMGQQGFEPSYVKRLGDLGADPELIADGLTSQEFLVSRNDRWIVVRSGGAWSVIDRVTTARTAIADTKLVHPLAISDDGRDALFHAACSELPGYCLAVADVVAGGVRRVAMPPNAILVANAFVDGSLRLVWVRNEAASPARLYLLEEWDERSGTTVRVGTMPDGTGGCLAWSWERRIAVGMVLEGTRGWPAISRMRIDLITPGGSRAIGSVDLRAYGSASDCQLSPDGRWFLYGDPTGHRGGGTLYLKAVPTM